MPLMLTLLLAICVLVMLYEVQGGSLDPKFVALLGLLVSINAALRFLEAAIPGPGGFSPIFFLIVLSGYVFGGKFGFLIGSLTIFVSALVTGGVGPWLPSQMIAAGWAGMSAPLCRPVVRAIGIKGRSGEVVILAVFGAFWGILYGMILNLWSWPFISGPAAQFWQPGISWAETLKRYLLYYLVTSLVWDLARAIGNLVFIMLFGGATLKVLRRFKRKFSFQYFPTQSMDMLEDSQN
jgi:energy-coupling factor transport system substrate-specific component